MEAGRIPKLVFLFQDLTNRSMSQFGVWNLELQLCSVLNDLTQQAPRQNVVYTTETPWLRFLDNSHCNTRNISLQQ